MKLIMENIRGFAGRHEHDIRPITLLVGENSTGKTTFAAMLHAVLHPRFPFAGNVFGRPPYQLHNLYDSIARKNGSAMADQFSLGIAIEHEQSFAQFVRGERAPRVEFLQVNTGATPFTLAPKGEGTLLSYGEEKIDLAYPIRSLDQDFINDLLNRISRDKPEPSSPSSKGVPVSKLSSQADSLPGLQGQESLQRQESLPRLDLFPGGVKAFAPVRAKPERVSIDPNTEFDPEGSHISALLREMNKKGKDWKLLEENLTVFGLESGLFKGIRVLPAATFHQLQAKVGKDWRSLTDVGYGISQILPVLVESILGKQGTLFILQQPEVHLHPRAQAALGTFFARLVKENPGTHFVLETHSDYLMDRVFQEVGKSTIKPKDVNLLYFERQEEEDSVQVHSIDIDPKGDVVNVPENYRRFFLEEVERNFGLRDEE